MCWVLLQYAALHGVCKDSSQAKSLYTFAPALALRTVVQGTPGHPWVHPHLLWSMASKCSHPIAEAVPYLSTQKCFTSWQSSFLSLAFLLSDLTPFCSWAFLPSMTAHSSVKKYHCNLIFPFIAKIHFRIWEWSRKGRVAENPQKVI